MHKAINQEKRFGQNGGGAWDFNLRDLLRWCQLCIKVTGDWTIFPLKSLKYLRLPVE